MCGLRWFGQAVVAEDLHVGWEMIALKHFKGFGGTSFQELT